MPRRQAQIAADKVVATQVFADTLSYDSIYSSSVVAITDLATTLDSTSSGKLITLDTSANAVTVTLPPVATSLGLKYEFVIQDTTGIITVTSDAGDVASTVIAGNFCTETAAGEGDTSIAASSFAFTTGAVKGDSFTLWCDSASWFVAGQIAITATVAFT